jgi:SAM-dependent methyltransferase
MAAIDDELAGAAIAARVGDFYERHPYPPPVDDLEDYSRKWDDRRRRADAHLFWPSEPYRDDRSVLVAGCGTTQAAKFALRWPRANVTGIDVSAGSLVFAEQMKVKYGLDNLRLKQLSIESVGELGKSFDHVVCTGVLHHLPDPDAALRALRDVLKPNGAMQLMVYAPYGRAGVYLIQDYCRRLGISATDAEIHDLDIALRSLPPDHPLVPLLRNSADFGKAAGRADALLHPRDRAYSIPQLLDFLRGGGLRFGRWLRQAAYLPQCGAPSLTPHTAKLMRLPVEEGYAAIELFRGTMVRHTVVAYRSDSSRTVTDIFDGNAWLHYVPIRLPDTIMVEEGLPAGAAAVLINRWHTYTDLYLPIDAQQKSLFDAIDGQRTIAEIAPDGALRPVARVLFERLWWYDQVVFDTVVKVRP